MQDTRQHLLSLIWESAHVKQWYRQQSASTWRSVTHMPQESWRSGKRNNTWTRRVPFKLKSECSMEHNTSRNSSDHWWESKWVSYMLTGMISPMHKKPFLSPVVKGKLCSPRLRSIRSWCRWRTARGAIWSLFLTRKIYNVENI